MRFLPLEKGWLVRLLDGNMSLLRYTRSQNGGSPHRHFEMADKVQRAPTLRAAGADAGSCRVARVLPRWLKCAEPSGPRECHGKLVSPLSLRSLLGPERVEEEGLEGYPRPPQARFCLAQDCLQLRLSLFIAFHKHA